MWKKLFYFLFFFSSLFIPSKVLAAPEPGYIPGTGSSKAGACLGVFCKPGELSNPVLPGELRGLAGSDFLGKFLQLLIRLGFFVGILAFVFLLILGAVRWITAGGDKAGLESAQKQITTAIVGLAILLSIFAIIQLVELIFGISIVRFNLPTF